MSRNRQSEIILLIIILILAAAAPSYAAGDNGYEQCTARYDNEFLYIDVTAATAGSWDMGMPYDAIQFKNGGSSVEIQLPYVSGSSQFEPRYKNGYAVVAGASGVSVYTEGTAQWKVKIPLEALWSGASGSGMEVSWKWRGGNVKLEPASIDDNGGENGDDDQGGDNGGGDQGGDEDGGNPGTPPDIGGNGILIDGYYDDWNGVPKTSISWGDNNGETFHKGAMIRDDDSIYVYLETHKKYDSQIPLSNMVFTVNGHNARAYLHFIDQSGTGPDWSRSSELYNLSRGIHLGLAPFADYPAYPRGTAAVTIERKNQTGGDRLEFAIKINELALIANVDPSVIRNGGEVTLYVSDLGPQKLTIVGTSTGTWIGIIISIAAVSGTFALRKYRRRKITV